MCGIAGLWAPSCNDEDVVRRVCEMTRAIAHRGPDAEDVWVESGTGLGLGHRRLSIFDLSDAGHQPMRSGCGTKVISFNGEIYNFGELRTQLADRGAKLISRTDTEVLLELLARDGVAATLPRLEGMFAFALWDRKERRLTLARDTIGKKPVLYQLSKAGLRFASELGAFLGDSGRAASRIDEGAAFLMLSFGVVPEPLSVLEDIRKLPPGHVAEFQEAENGTVVERTWRWSDPVAARVTRSKASLAEFEDVFAAAVSLRLAADVPLGAFLSGGIDSSLVAAQAQSLMSERLKTFTIGFDVEGYDESAHALAVAEHLGTDHHVLQLSALDMEESCLTASSWYDEPFADASAIPTRILCAFARETVTVALTGDGGDETFLGYPLHRSNAWLVSALTGTPAPLRRALAAVVGLTPHARGDWWARALRNAGAGDFYLSQRIGGFRPAAALLEPVLDRLPPLADRRSNAEWLGDCDLSGYLVDDMLTKVDRASMSVGLEARSPLLDQRVVALAQSVPLARKIGGGRGKLLLREALARRFPEALFRRPKSGFRAPIGDWLNRPRLREWSHAHAEKFDSRFGWRSAAGLNARSLWSANREAPDAYGDDLWRVCQLMDWSARHGL